MLFSKINIDVVFMPVNVSARPRPGCLPEKAIVMARDDLSGWVEADALAEVNSESVSRFFLGKVIARFGRISQVSADGSSEFKGDFVQLLWHQQIPLVRISAYNAAGNGRIECGHGPIKEALYKMMQTRGPDWVSLLLYVLWADQATARRLTGYSPARLLYGQECVLPIDAEFSTYLAGRWSVGPMDTVSLLVVHAQQLKCGSEDRRLARHIVQQERECSIIHGNRSCEAQQRNRVLAKDDLVLVRNSLQDQRKMAYEDRYLGPYRIHHISDQGAATLEELDGTEIKDDAMRKIGHVRLRRFMPRVESLSQVGLPRTVPPNYRPRKDTTGPQRQSESLPAPRGTTAPGVSYNSWRWGGTA
jgi:hypothetical protein